ncbi:hypothetical protein GmHk_18G051161 [Glycine max]|nr:hypothetical protein GmHk_18G051161 [Glycine max]
MVSALSGIAPIFLNNVYFVHLPFYVNYNRLHGVLIRTLALSSLHSSSMSWSTSTKSPIAAMIL